jgi:hypothetical protein
VAAKGNVLELLRPDDTGKVISICSTPVFCIIRSLHPFRLAGMHYEFITLRLVNESNIMPTFNIPFSRSKQRSSVDRIRFW